MTAATSVAAFEAGIYSDLSDDAYHADPVPGRSLSVSGAKRLLPPKCPAVFKHERDHGRPNKDEFDFGHVYHRLVLGAGMDYVVVDKNDWRTNEAKEAKAAAYAAGKAPILRKDFETAQAMARKVRQHPKAAELLDMDNGLTEQSAFWQDPETGTWLRMRADYMRHPEAPGPMAVVDLKTTTDANPDRLGKPMWDFGYCMQSPWYLDILQALGYADEAATFYFIFQEKTAPYLVSVAALDSVAMRIGRQRNREAIDLYALCVERDEWPGYTDEITYVSLPGWVEAKYKENW